MMMVMKMLINVVDGEDLLMLEAELAMMLCYLMMLADVVLLVESWNRSYLYPMTNVAFDDLEVGYLMTIMVTMLFCSFEDDLRNCHQQMYYSCSHLADAMMMILVVMAKWSVTIEVSRDSHLHMTFDGG
jgi:hypothetical protein